MKEFDSRSEFDETLRLLAQAPAPEGLAERVQSRLKAAPRASLWRRIFLVSPLPGRRLLHAMAVAALVGIVVGIGWTVLSLYSARTATRANAPQAAPAERSGFSAAGAVRKPATVEGPTAPQTGAGK